MWTNQCLAILCALAALVAQSSPAALAQTTAPTPPGERSTVTASPGDQTDPHVSGALVTYTNDAEGRVGIRYHNFLTGADAAVPNPNGQDFLSDVSGTTIVYTGFIGGRTAIYAYDTSTQGPPVELDQRADSNRLNPAIGARSVAWVDRRFLPNPQATELVVYDLDTRVATRLTDDELLDVDPALSPDGSVVVWTKCALDDTACDIWQATRAGSAWTARRLTGAEGYEVTPDTNGQVVVYTSTKAGEPDVHWQPLGGGAERRLALAGDQRNPSISGTLIAFESLLGSNYELFVYDLATDTLYRITETPVNEQLNDITVAPDGLVRVVWSAPGTSLDLDVFAFSFRVPPATRTPATVLLTPADDVNPVGTSHTVTATVRDASGQPVPGVTVRFSVEGSVTRTASCTANAAGQCELTYTGPQLPGADLISAYADIDADDTRDVGEPLGEATKAWLLPTTTPGQVTGAGQIANARGTDQIAFGFNAKSADGSVKGACNLVDPSTNTRIKCLDATTLVQTATTATIFGNATVNGTATTYRIDVEDKGEPGRGQDTFRIQTASGYTAGGVLTQGNIHVNK